MSEPVTPWWLGWILPMLGVMAVVWTTVKRLFTTAVRDEMSQMHGENQARLLTVETRLGEIEVSLGTIEGYIKGLTEK